MIRYEVILTSKAKNELNHIYNYIYKSLIAKKAADDFLAKLKNSILRLETMPKSCSIINEISTLKREYRKLIVSNFLIIYRIDETNKKVYILKIVYRKTNYLNNFRSF